MFRLFLPSNSNLTGKTAPKEIKRVLLLRWYNFTGQNYLDSPTGDITDKAKRTEVKRVVTSWNWGQIRRVDPQKYANNSCPETQRTNLGAQKNGIYPLWESQRNSWHWLKNRSKWRMYGWRWKRTKFAKWNWLGARCGKQTRNWVFVKINQRSGRPFQRFKRVGCRIRHHSRPNWL